MASKCPICHKELPAPLPLQVWVTCGGCGSEFRVVAQSNEVYPTTAKRKLRNQTESQTEKES